LLFLTFVLFATPIPHIVRARIRRRERPPNRTTEDSPAGARRSIGHD
jgi:hypothetical protein